MELYYSDKDKILEKTSTNYFLTNVNDNIYLSMQTHFNARLGGGKPKNRIDSIKTQKLPSVVLMYLNDIGNYMKLGKAFDINFIKSNILDLVQEDKLIDFDLISKSINGEGTNSVVKAFMSEGFTHIYTDRIDYISKTAYLAKAEGNSYVALVAIDYASHKNGVSTTFGVSMLGLNKELIEAIVEKLGGQDND